MRKLFLLSLSCLAFAPAIGCKETLETGYQPRPLNASDEARRAYYAPAFSPEAQGRGKDDVRQSPIRPGRTGGY
jgi:hypothetical protein